MAESNVKPSPIIGEGFNKPVLILGNGISRLLFHDEIEAWEGEVWGCNRVYLEYPHKLTCLTGHVSILVDALKYAKENNYKYNVYGGNQGRYPKKEFKALSVAPEFCKDSGTTLIAKALVEKRSCINVCGFDLGGADIGSRGMQTFTKHSWIRRWRSLYSVFKEDWTIKFWGHDHMPIINGYDDRDAHAYADIYNKFVPHVDDYEYKYLYYAIYGIPEDLRKALYGPRDLVPVKWLDGRLPQSNPLVYWLALIEEDRSNLEILDKPTEEEQERFLARVTVGVLSIKDRLSISSLRHMALCRDESAWHCDGTKVKLLGIGDKVLNMNKEELLLFIRRNESSYVEVTDERTA